MYRWPGRGSGWRRRRGLLRQAPVTVVTTIEITLPDALAEEAKEPDFFLPRRSRICCVANWRPTA
jgi:hypothetical protein